MRFASAFAAILILVLMVSCESRPNNAIVVQTDFGEKDGAVAAMKGVAMNVSTHLKIFDLTHEIPVYNIWEAAYRLQQVYGYWPTGTVFVSVVDPGVGTERESVVARTRSGKFIVTPDNGTLTLINDIESIRKIDESINRRKGSLNSHTFHGRDVYMFTAARLASGEISFDQVGPEVRREAVKISYQEASFTGNIFYGNIPVLDIQYGNVWTNIPEAMINRFGIQLGDSLDFEIKKSDSVITMLRVPFVKSFGVVKEGQALSYINSLGNLAMALNMGNIAVVYGIQSGAEWTVRVRRATP